MRFFLWTAATWALMFLGILAIDVGYTVSTGRLASPAVTQRIDFTPRGTNVLGWIEQMSRTLDRMGDKAFGRFVGLAEMLLYGVLAPLLIVGPIGWEAHRRQWNSNRAAIFAGVAGTLICLWAAWKPGLWFIYYGLVNALLLCCHALGLSYYGGSFIYFIVLPVAFFLSYVGVRTFS